MNYKIQIQNNTICPTLTLKTVTSGNKTEKLTVRICSLEQASFKLLFESFGIC